MSKEDATTMKNTIKKMIAGAALAAALIAPAQASAQVKGNVEAIASERQDNSYGRINLIYKLPASVDGYTFLEFYQKDNERGNGFFGKTSLKRKIAGGLMARAEVNHVNEPATRLGIGLHYNLPMPKNTYANVKVLPYWIDNQGRHIDNRVIVGYAAGVNLGAGFKLESFGEANAACEGKTGATQFRWGYGEIKLSKAIGKNYEIGYNPGLYDRSTKDSIRAMPSLEHRVNFAAKF